MSDYITCTYVFSEHDETLIGQAQFVSLEAYSMWLTWVATTNYEIVQTRIPTNYETEI